LEYCAGILEDKTQATSRLHYSRQVMEKIDEIPCKTSVRFRPHIEQVRKLDL
jgi:hypothetical protein